MKRPDLCRPKCERSERPYPTPHRRHHPAILSRHLHPQMKRPVSAPAEV